MARPNSSVEIAQAGGNVRGVDLDADRVGYAQRDAEQNFPELAAHLRFDHLDAADLPDDQPFDVIVSKDTFEQVDDVAGLLASLYRLLEPGGVLYTGFSPLYYSPFGDHGRTG